MLNPLPLLDTPLPTSPPQNTDITKCAHAFATAYASAIRLKHVSPCTPSTTIAKHISTFYHPTHFINFNRGKASNLGPEPKRLRSIKRHLDAFEDHGLGLDIRMEACRVEVVSEWSAMVWISWRIYPGIGEGWAWENMYAFRVDETVSREEEEEGRVGVWEFCVSDNEMQGLLSRFPDFMKGRREVVI